MKRLEQSGHSLPPEVKIHHFFKPFITDYLPERLNREDAENAMLLIADTRAGSLLTAKSFTHPTFADKTTFIAIGPESGWSEKEVEQFTELGFRRFSLGERIFRVETALTYLLGQIDLIRRS